MPVFQSRRLASCLAPSAAPFDSGHPVPRAVTLLELDEIEALFSDSAQRALAAGFRLVELQMAHGSLLREFLSPLVNKRQDDYGYKLTYSLGLKFTSPQ